MHEVCILHKINTLRKITLKTALSKGCRDSILAEIFQKSAKFYRAGSPRRAKKRVFWGKNQIKDKENVFLYIWVSMCYKKNAEKIKKVR